MTMMQHMWTTISTDTHSMVYLSTSKVPPGS